MIGKNAQGAMRLSQIVMPDDDEGLIRFFEVAPGEFDFSPIAEHRRIARIGNELRSSAQASLPIYMFKQPIIDEPGRFEILSATDAEFKNETERRRFFEHAMLQEQCSVKIVISKAAKLPIHFVDSVTDKLQQHSSHRAHKLREAIGDIEFIGDMVNITRESTEMFIDQINRR
ncbi:hypothetical protein BOW53_06475 [Solemya pervernicosa gill symbiont]|uniref:Uncharacterized protein n=2 Tax=Gammaproteobacteria incertae sedis TaxID=118884 RepID=A0A1T2L6N0_9GAMM|nr:hypothetical protein [Solemya pervernicosa gill symbiont]OOZ40759.1 hypothetical protein BOW53_06475 [Solemya pervernicosa gill symbiont]